MRQVRRVVTGHDRNGKSMILFNDLAPKDPGGVAADVWGTFESPAKVSGTEDVAGSFAFNPPRGGTVFRYAQIVPDSTLAHLDEETRRKMFRDQLAALAGADAVGDQSRHPGMHRTPTVDYVVLLSGKVTLIMDEGEVDLEPFDIVIQRATAHGWSNRGSEPAILLAVMVDAEPV